MKKIAAFFTFLLIVGLLAGHYKSTLEDAQNSAQETSRTAASETTSAQSSSVPLRSTEPSRSRSSNSSSSGSSADDSSDIRGWSRAEARRACHKEIEKQLKSPRSAKFEGLFEAEFSKSKGGRSWTVRGHVDAQNSFGAEVRNSYRCTVTPSSSANASVSVSLSGI